MVIYNEMIQDNRPCTVDCCMIRDKYCWLWNLNVVEEELSEEDLRDYPEGEAPQSVKKYSWWSFQGQTRFDQGDRFGDVIEYCRLMLSEFPDDAKLQPTARDYIELLSQKWLWGPDKSEWDYGEIIQGLLKWKYTNDEIQAVQNNYLDAVIGGEQNTEAEREYREFSEYRKSCKQMAREIMA